MLDRIIVLVLWEHKVTGVIRNRMFRTLVYIGGLELTCLCVLYVGLSLRVCDAKEVLV